MKIRELTVNTFWKGEVGVRGLVEDNGKEYRVQLYGKGSAVRDYSCSCPEGNSWRGMCPHAKVLWEAYQKKEKNQGGSGSGLVFTSQEVRTMIREYTNREVARIQLEGQEGAVRFLARLSISGGGKEIRAEFKVGREKQYVIRDLTAFAQAMNHGTYVEYGKNFAFYHSLDAFTPESRPLVEFVVELVNVYRDYYAQFRRTSFDSHPPLRELNLSRENRDRFFAIVAGQTLEVENGLKGKRSLQVCSQNPRFYVQVQRQGRDGLSVSFDPKSFLFFGEKCLYVGDEERIYCCDEECSRVMGVFAAQMSQSVKHTVTVNQKDIPLLYERVLRRIEPYCVFQDEEINWEEYRSEPLKAEFRFTSEEPGEITMEPVLSYGEYTFHPIEDETLPRTVCRDVPGEFRISQLIARYFRYKEPEGKKLVIRGDDEAMFRLMESGMAEFAQLGNILVDDSVRHMRILPPLSVRTSVSMNGGWLDIRLDMVGLTASDLEQIL